MPAGRQMDADDCAAAAFIPAIAIRGAGPERRHPAAKQMRRVHLIFPPSRAQPPALR